MKSTFRLGRIAGIQVGAHWSVFAIAALIAWTLATYVLPELEPGYGVVSYWSVGLVVAVIFFASLLAHEFGHSIVARRHGIKVDEITLWLLGGVSKLGADSETAGDEFRMAVIGPVISLGLGFAFAFVAGLGALAGVPDLLVTGVMWLAVTNLLLGFFNLLPAFPLDGGRVLRAMLWGRSGNRLRATQTAARVGQACGYGLVALGVAEFLYGGLGGLWMVLLGWFITQAARSEAAIVAQHELLADTAVRDIMSVDPVTVPEQLTIDDVINGFVLGARHSAYPVVTKLGMPVGLIDLDAIRRVKATERWSTTAGAAMEPLSALVVVAPTDAVNDVLPRMVESRSRRAIVIDERGHLVGLVTMTDIGHTMEARGVTLTSPRTTRESTHAMHEGNST